MQTKNARPSVLLAPEGRLCMTPPRQRTRETNMPGQNDQDTKRAPTRETSGARPTCPAAYCSRRILTRRCCAVFDDAGGVSALGAASVSNAEETAGDGCVATDGNAAIAPRLGGDDHDSLDREDECKTHSSAGRAQRLGRSPKLTEVEVQQRTRYKNNSASRRKPPGQVGCLHRRGQPISRRKSDK